MNQVIPDSHLPVVNWEYLVSLSVLFALPGFFVRTGQSTKTGMFTKTFIVIYTCTTKKSSHVFIGSFNFGAAGDLRLPMVSVCRAVLLCDVPYSMEPGELGEP